jgi:hypothetical protein
MAATNKIMVMRPETVARTAPGLDHSPLFSCCHRRLTNIILNFCHLCSRRWQPSNNPHELFRQNSPFLVTAPHQTGARNSAHTRPKPDKANRIVAGTAFVGRAASRATTRANPHHLARLFLLLDTAHLGRADAPRCGQSKPTFLWAVKGTARWLNGNPGPCTARRVGVVDGLGAECLRSGREWNRHVEAAAIVLAWRKASTGSLKQSEMYDVGVRPSYDRSASSIFALRPEWCSAEQGRAVGAEGAMRVRVFSERCSRRPRVGRRRR